MSQQRGTISPRDQMLSCFWQRKTRKNQIIFNLLASQNKAQEIEVKCTLSSNTKLSDMQKSRKIQPVLRKEVKMDVEIIQMIDF